MTIHRRPINGQEPADSSASSERYILRFGRSPKAPLSTLKRACLLILAIGWTLSPLIASAVDFELVPDRPGYADSTHSVAPRHWHIELGSSWNPESDLQGGLLIRYGLPKGWELRLMSPTFTQPFAVETPLDPQPTTPPLEIGGAALGAKWSGKAGSMSFSLVTMVGVPVMGASAALSPDALFSLGAQLDYPLNEKISVGLAFKSSLLDETTPALESAYGEELGSLLGLVGAVSWSEVDWSLYAQSGVESVVDTLTPLVGAGGTLRISRNTQLDLSADAPFSSEGVTPRYTAGLTIGW